MPKLGINWGMPIKTQQWFHWGYVGLTPMQKNSMTFKAMTVQQLQPWEWRTEEHPQGVSQANRLLWWEA